MKIISWNVNGFRAAMRKGAIEDLILEHDPDLLFVQELKCTEYEFLRAIGEYSDYITDNYLCYVDGSTIPGRYGVALLAKNSIALDSEGNHLIRWYNAEDIDPKLKGYREARLQAFVINDILMLNTYSVRVTPEMEGFRNSQKYNDHLLNLLAMWKDLGNKEALVIGDVNITPNPKDQHELKVTLPMLNMSPEERERYTILFNQSDLHDTFRVLHPNKIKYSYWSYKFFSREKGKGYRLDYALATTALMEKVVNADILTFFMGSDHAPIILELVEE